MTIDLRIQIKTLEDLERCLLIEQTFYLMDIFPAPLYEADKKIRSMCIDDNIHKKVKINNESIHFDVKPDTDEYEALMFIESLLRQSEISFDTGYDLIGKTRDWFLNNIRGPMKFVIADR